MQPVLVFEAWNDKTLNEILVHFCYHLVIRYNLKDLISAVTATV